MKLSIAALFLSVIASAALIGCTSNAQLRVQLAQAEQIAHQQDEQIAELSARQQKLNDQLMASSSRKVGEDVAKDAGDMFSTVWSWSVEHVTEAVHSTEELAHRCYEQGKGHVHSVEDAKELASSCWNAN